jgi:hypothetical protein
MVHEVHLLREAAWALLASSGSAAVERAAGGEVVSFYKGVPYPAGAGT